MNYGLGSYLRAQIRKRDARASKADLKEGAELREFEAIEKLKNSKRPHGVPALGLEIESEGSESESKKME